MKSKYNELNETFIELTKISKYFHLIYVDGFKNKKMTYNIIFNLHLIREINSYINKNINKNPKKGIKKFKIKFLFLKINFILVIHMAIYLLI